MPQKLSLLVATVAASPVAWLLGTSVLCAQPAPSWNMYTSDTSLVVTFPTALNSKGSDGSFKNHTANIDIQVAGSSTIGVTVDTGSTGIAISQSLLPAGALNGLTPLGPGAYNYDSSGNTPTGMFYQLPVSILGKVSGQTAAGTTSVKVLVVTSDTTNPTAYFGIGNNRNNVYSGTYNPSLTFKQNVDAKNIVQIVPDGMNPALNVAVNGTALPNQGYVVKNDQLVVGLTKANNTYTFVKLTPDTAAGASLWNQIPVALKVGTSGSYATDGQILQDTGIFNAYLLPQASTGEKVQVSIPGIPGFPEQGAFYSFVVPATPATGSCPTTSAMQPCQVLNSTLTPFLNTGRQFYAGFDYLFDPVNGYAGYALSSSGLATEAKLVPLLALQGTVPLSNGFDTNLPTALFAATTLTTQTGATATFNGAFTGYGNSLTLGGSGTVVFNGPVNLATGGGTFTVGSGAVATINNTLTAGSVTNQGTLGGSGTVNGDVINSGVISPGNSIGTFSIVGNYTHSARGAHLAEVHPSGISDKVVIAGTAAIQGGALNVVTQSGIYAPRTTYNLISAGNGVSGSFSSVSSDSPFLVPTLSYDANNAYLTLQIGGFAAAAQTPTQAAVGAALDAGAPSASGDFATILGALATLNSSQVLPFLTSISGQNYSAFSNSMVQGAQLFMNNFALQVGGGSVGPRGSTRVALAEACTVACQTFLPPNWGAWGSALGGTGTVGSGTTSGATTYNVGGFAAGLDRLLTSNFLAGVTVGYTTGRQWVSGFNGQSSTNTFQVGLYGSFFEGPFYLDGMASYAYSTNQMWRNIAIPNLQQRTAQGLTGANQFFGQLEGGYRITLGGTAMAFVTPFARLQGYTGTQNAFTETGAQSLNLSVEAQTTNSLRSVIGAQLGGSMDFGWRDRVYAQLRLGWSHEYADVSRPVTAALAGAPRFLFTTWGATPTRDGAVVGLSATTEVAQASSIYLRYEGNIAGQDSTHALTAGLRMTW